MSDSNNAKFVAIVGSLRASSVNAATARAAVSVAPDGIDVEIVDITEIPLYDGDVHEAGMPESVTALIESVGAADGLLIFSPEYNGSFPAVTKNVIDWLSVGPPSVSDGLAMGLVTTTPGPRGGSSLRDHFTFIMSFRPVRAFETLGIADYGDKLDDAGEIVHTGTHDELADYVSRFAEFTRQPD